MTGNESAPECGHTFSQSFSKPVRRVSTVLPLSFLAHTIPIPVPPGRIEPIVSSIGYEHDVDTLYEVAAALSRAEASHIRMTGCVLRGSVQGSNGTFRDS